MLGEHGAAIGVDFTEGNGSHAGTLEPETESADPTEKIEDIHSTAAKMQCATSVLPCVSQSAFLDRSTGPKSLIFKKAVSMAWKRSGVRFPVAPVPTA